jgi:hypothetical protein
LEARRLHEKASNTVAELNNAITASLYLRAEGEAMRTGGSRSAIYDRLLTEWQEKKRRDRSKKSGRRFHHA